MAAPVESVAAESAEASPLWPLVLVLAAIAARLEREQAAPFAAETAAVEPADDAA